jgi:hypothetical protein
LKIDRQDVTGGLILGAIGAFVLLQAAQYGIGTARRMGAGYFPMILGAAALLVGLLIAVRGLGRDRAIEIVEWRPALAILGAVAAFALLVRSFGMIPAVAAAGALAALGDRNTTLKGGVWLILIVSTGIWLVFLVGLRLPIAAFRMPS